MKSGCVSQQTKPKRNIELPVISGTEKAADTVSRSRMSKWRAGALITLNLLMVAHIVQWKIMGTTVSPIEPSEAMYTLQSGAVNAGFIFFTLAILATLIFGRFVCGWGCHIVALQDLCGWLLKKMGLRPRPFRSRLLMLVPLGAALYMFVWPTVNRFLSKPPNEPLIPQFTNHLITTDFWATFPPIWVAIPFLFVCGFMTVYFLGQKGFCTYGCPYGGFFVIADKFAPGKIRVTDACNECGHCTAVCTSNVIVHKEVKEHGMVVDPGCMKCMDCVSVCPNDALYFGFGKPSAAVKKEAATNRALTWPEEIVGAAAFLASYFAVWNVYQLVPMLMAIGIAIVTAYLAVRTLKLFRSNDLAFYRFSLKSGGRIKRAGWAFRGFTVLWMGLIVHSGYIVYHEQKGSTAFQSIQLPDELALAESDPGQWLSAADRETIGSGRDHLRTASSYGLFRNVDAMPKLAWMEYLSGNRDEAIALLETSAAKQSGQAKALSLYYRGAILNRTGRPEQAMSDLDTALELRPDLVTAREEKGESLWRLGRPEAAFDEWKRAVEANPALPLANNFLAAAAGALGNPEEAAKYQARADAATPMDPYFHWMLGLRLRNLGMDEQAERQFRRAGQLDQGFRQRFLQLQKNR
ncbi:MAG: tetratricopeptide repeat protein [Pyrinomonadaceae bacterium]